MQPKLMRETPELVIRTATGKTNSIRLEKDRYTIGRLTTNDLCFPDDGGLSRQHAVLELDGDYWTVSDLGSRNGTYLNGTRLSGKRRLVPGDEIQAGHVRIVFGGSPTAAAHTVIFKPDDSVTEGSAVKSNLREALQTAESTQRPAAGLTPLAAILRAGRELAARRPIVELFSTMLDLAIEAVGAQRGLLLTCEGDKLVVQASRGQSFHISTTVRDTVLRDKSSLLVRDTSQDAALRAQQSIVLQQVRTLMAVPLQTDDRVLGLIYLDTPTMMRDWTSDDLNLVTVMANVAAIRLERERLAAAEEARRLLAKEIEQAAEIQRRFLPIQAPTIDGLDAAGFNFPSRSVGGDYYDFLACGDGRSGFIIADVAGKGMPAALMMMNLQARVQVLAESVADPGDFVSRLNRIVAQNCPDNRFITLFYCTIDPRSGHIEYANAGHNPPLIARKTGAIEQLAGGGPPLGILPALQYRTAGDVLEESEMLVLYSDGVTEVSSLSGEEFGEERLCKLVLANREASAADVVETIAKQVTDWAGGAPAGDDVTILVVKRDKAPNV